MKNIRISYINDHEQKGTPELEDLSRPLLGAKYL